MTTPLIPIVRGRNRWLTNMSTVATLTGIALAVAYTWVSVSFPPGSSLSFFITLALVTITANTLGDTIEQRRLLTVKELGEGKLPPTPENLLLAAHETLNQPGVSFSLVALFLSLGAVATASIWSLASDVPAHIAARVGLIGLVVAPLTAVLALVVSIPRSRQMLRELVAAGLPVQMLYAGAPASFVLRRRLMVFGGIAVLTPMVLLIDLTLSQLWEFLEAIQIAPDEATMQALLVSHRIAAFPPILALLVLVVFVVSLCAWLSGTILGDPLRELAAETERLGRGEHRDPRFIPAEHESLAAAAAISQMEAEVVVLLHRLGGTARELTGATESLRVADVTPLEDQRIALDATSSTTAELARSAKDIAANAERVSQLARRTWAAAREGRDGADGFLAAMGQVRQGNQAIADSVVRLNKRVQQVGRIVEFIDGIADRSDLLALNAELEGNKAGEVGRGFSLVAAEMRRLAESVMGSTREIARLIEEIRDATNAAVMATEAGVKATDAGAALSQKVGDGLARIVDYANQSSDAMQSISLATTQQRVGTDQLVTAMGDILSSTEASASATMEMVAAHEQLVTLVKDLEKTVDRFEVES